MKTHTPVPSGIEPYVLSPAIRSGSAERRSERRSDGFPGRAARYATRTYGPPTIHRTSIAMEIPRR